MTTLRFHLDDHLCTFAGADGEHVAPLGATTLSPMITGDPPRADDLSNAIGLVLDTVDDVLRLLPDISTAELVTLSGAAPRAVADLEVGGLASLPFVLTRDAAEDVFRTVATERRAERARNPGLDAAMVDTIVGTCCVVVGLMRRLRLDAVEVVASMEEQSG
jgi:exopolyphosphatase/guanosine-5'-triphosphate,3'-diphosphate pyrophosphatase